MLLCNIRDKIRNNGIKKTINAFSEYYVARYNFCWLCLTKNEIKLFSN